MRRHWLVVGLLVSLTGLMQVRSASQQRAALAQWGDAAFVVATTRDVAPGEPLTEENTDLRRVPLVLVSANAVHELASGSVAHRHLDEGTLLTVSDVAPDDPASPHHRTVAVPIHHDHPPLDVGTAIELVVSRDVDPYDGTSSESEVIEGWIVLAAGPMWLIEVHRDAVPALASAAVSGTVVPVILPVTHAR